MKVLAISGSPRKKGNTEYFLTQALAHMSASGFETELLTLDDKVIKPCRACLACRKELRCTQEGDDFHAIYDKMTAADGIIVGSPVHFSGPAPALVALLDRAGYCSRQSRRFFSGKVGAPVAVARRAGHNFTFAWLLLWFFVNDFIIPGSTYWNVGMAGEGGARDAEADKEGLDTIAHFAKNMARVLTALHA
ncbi:MAG: flavodoxin family protein [Bacillota bacterium]|nr:MAG: flavodoxin family protein [Bacillota bacterium]